MPRKTAPVRARGERSRWIGACVSDTRARKRVEGALRGHAEINWFDSFDALRRGVEAHGRMSIVIVGLNDPRGGSATSLAMELRGAGAGTAVVACCDVDEKLEAISELA